MLRPEIYGDLHVRGKMQKEMDDQTDIGRNFLLIAAGNTLATEEIHYYEPYINQIGPKAGTRK